MTPRIFLLVIAPALLLPIPMIMAADECVEFECPDAQLWCPQKAGARMTENVYQAHDEHRQITWIEDRGFSMSVDGEATYDNWFGVDEAAQVRIGIDAPRDVDVYREEIYEQVRQENLSAIANVDEIRQAVQDQQRPAAEDD